MNVRMYVCVHLHVHTNTARENEVLATDNREEFGVMYRYGFAFK